MSIRTLSLAAAALFVSVVGAMLLHVAVPEALHFAERSSPVSGSVISEVEMQQKERVALQQLHEAIESTPRITLGSLVGSALSRFGAVAFLPLVVLLFLLRRQPATQRVLALVPLLGLAVWSGGAVLLVGLLVLALVFEGALRLSQKNART